MNEYPNIKLQMQELRGTYPRFVLVPKIYVWMKNPLKFWAGAKSRKKLFLSADFLFHFLSKLNFYAEQTSSKLPSQQFFGKVFKGKEIEYSEVRT